MALHSQKKTCSVKRKSRKQAAKRAWKKQRQSGNVNTAIEETFSQDASADESLPDLLIEPESYDSTYVVTGRRMVNFSYLFQSLITLEHDGFGCKLSDMIIVSENRYWLKSVFAIKCKMCNNIKSVSTESEESVEINKCAVSAAMATGIGYSQLTEICAALDLPSMSHSTYAKNAVKVEDVLRDSALEEMQNATKHEAALSKKAGEVDEDGTPVITIIADGAYCKRSHGTNYNASSGVGGIIGARTKKLLYVGVKNKYCSVCHRSKTAKRDVLPHKYFKNWNGTTTSMEAQIILDGFKSSMDMYGIKYTRIIGDGDSSVHRKILNSKPYGPHFHITKIECRNHILRNDCKKIREL